MNVENSPNQMQKDLENTQVQMRKGILEFCILHIISRGEIYSTSIIQELKTARIAVVEGTLYPLLTRLKNAGLLQYNWKESSAGPPQKHYQLTEQGRAFLVQLNETWIDLVDSTNQIISKTNAELYQRILDLQMEAVKVKRNI
jgi:PadR family transcriptional regulator, regulatory protein PadR